MMEGEDGWGNLFLKRYRSVLFLLEVLRHPYWELRVNSLSETFQVGLAVVSAVTFLQVSALSGWLQLPHSDLVPSSGVSVLRLLPGPQWFSQTTHMLILQWGISRYALIQLSQFRRKKLGEGLIQENVSPDTEVKLSVNKKQHHKALHTPIVNLFLLQLLKSLILCSVTFNLFSSYHRMFQT